VKIDNFFAELKRRNVYKVAVAYAVVAWLTIQAASIFLPAFNAPQWAMHIVVLILVLGSRLHWFFPGRSRSRRKELCANRK
jgi:hypothetical protein